MRVREQSSILWVKYFKESWKLPEMLADGTDAKLPGSWLLPPVTLGPARLPATESSCRVLCLELPLSTPATLYQACLQPAPTFIAVPHSTLYLQVCAVLRNRGGLSLWPCVWAAGWSLGGNQRL